MPKFRVGQYVIYKKGDTYQLGKIMRVVDEDKVSVFYHGGDTAARTNIMDLFPIENDYVIKEVTLGGSYEKPVGTIIKVVVEVDPRERTFDTIETCSECGSVNIDDNDICLDCGAELIRE